MWRLFLKDNLEFKSTMLGLINELKAKNDIQVKCAQCDHSGESKDFEQACMQKRMEIEFEYTAPCTQEQKAILNRKLLPSSIGYMPYSMAEKIISF